MPRFTPHRALAVFFSAILLLAGATARADERALLVDQVMQTGPLGCSAASEAAWSANLVDDLSLMMTEGVGHSLGLNQQWAPGNRDFDRVRALMAARVVADQAGPRPMFRRISVADGVRAALQAMPMDELRFAAGFFSRPAGQLYWELNIDHFACELYGPVLASSHAGAARSAVLSARRAALKAGFEARLARRKLAEKQEYDAGGKRLGSHIVVAGIPELDKDAFDAHFARLKELRPHVEQIAAPYKLKPGPPRK